MQASPQIYNELGYLSPSIIEIVNTFLKTVLNVRLIIPSFLLGVSFQEGITTLRNHCRNAEIS